MRRPHVAATALAVLLLLLLCLAVLTAALIHGNGGLAGRMPTRWAAAVPRKMLLAMTSFDAAASPSSTAGHHHHHHLHHHHHHHHHQHHHHHHHQADRRWNRHGIIPAIPPSAAGEGDEAIDPRYGVQKRLVPSGPNPLHH